MLKNLRRLVALVGAVALVWFWNHESASTHSNKFHLAVMFLVLLPVPAISALGRFLLRKPRSAEQIVWITLFVHYTVAWALGTAIISAFKVARVYPLLVIPFNRSVGFALANIAAGLVTLTVVTLAIRALGAPFALALSRRLATGWLYRYTRNPMVVSLIAFFIAAGLWLQSTLFLIWTVCALVPAELSMLKLFEERELELRFGDEYLAYKRSTPMLLGRRRELQRAATTGQ